MTTAITQILKVFADDGPGDLFRSKAHWRQTLAPQPDCTCRALASALQTGDAFFRAVVVDAEAPLFT